MSSVEDDLTDKKYAQGGAESDLSKVVTILLNEKWGKRKTRLRDRIIPALTTLSTIAEIYDIQCLKDWIKGYTEYVVSIEGKGRQEIVDITKFSIDKQDSFNREVLKLFGNR